MPTKEKSKITLEVDKKVVGTNYHDVKDAMTEAKNRLDEGAKKAVITEVTTLEKTKKK